MKGIWATLVYILLLLTWIPGLCQPEDSTNIERLKRADSLNSRKLNHLMLGAGVGYTMGLFTLNEVWYKNQEDQQFAFFNDLPEWKQMDKAGHFYGTYQLSKISRNALRNVGMTSRKAHVYGSIAGFAALFPVEVLDGFSETYGASWSDWLANGVGAAFFTGQYLLWKEQRIHPKFSFHQTSLAPLRSKVLGNSFMEQMLKDYNGQTYWLSVDVADFLAGKNGATRFPEWLNVAVGYGGHQMLFGRDWQNRFFGRVPYRQYFLGVDLDLSHFKKEPVGFKNKLWNSLIYIVDGIRLPAPALEYNNRGGWHFWYLYY